MRAVLDVDHRVLRRATPASARVCCGG
jgi:hypothetical protein